MADQLKSIICIEDDADMNELIQLILRRKGFKVDGAMNGSDGLRKIREAIPDLVLLDLMIGDPNGWEVYQQLKADEKTKEIPVMIVTAKAECVDKVLGLYIAKVVDYVSKPFLPSDLIERVNKVLAKKSPEKNI